MNKRQKGLTSAGTFLGLVCGLVLTQQVVSADTNATTDQNTPVAVQTESTDTTDGNNTGTPAAQQVSATDDNNDIVTNSSSAVASDTSVASNNTTASGTDSTNTATNNVNQPVASTTTDSDGSTSESTSTSTTDSVASGVWGTSAWDLVQQDKDCTLTFHAGTLGSGSIKSNVLADNTDWINGLTTINFDPGVVANADSSYLFANLNSVVQINLANLVTSQITNMYEMFSDDSSLASLDLSNFNTSNVTTMQCMFYGDSSLTSLDLSNFDMSKVTNMDGMFSGDSSLTSLYLSNFDMSKVTNMSGMFSGDSSLVGLDLSGFDTSKVTDMSYMFAGDSSLTGLDLSNFDTSQVTSMAYMFAHDSKLTSLDLSNFDTSNVTYMSGMFYYDSSLTNLDLSNFDTFQVIDMAGMFWHDGSLTSLNLSNFDTSKVNDTTAIVWYDGNLSHLILGSKTNLHYDSYLTDVPQVGTSIPGTNKTVTSPNWVATSGYQQGKKYSSQDLINLTGRDQVTVYDWDSTPVSTTETHSVTRTINFHLPNGLTQTQTQRAFITRIKTLNSDGTVSYSAWTPAQWSNVDIPEIPDYKASQPDIPEVDIDSDTADQTIDVYYTPIQHTLTINYVDADGKTVSSQKYSGAKGSTITPQYYLPDGYQLASVPPMTVQMGNADQTINVLVSHALDFSDEQHSIVRLINVHQPNGQIQTVTQWVTLKRSVKIDRVTGAKTYGHWSMDYWDEYEVPTFSGYTPSQSTVEETPVSSDMADQVVDIYYTQA